MKSIILLFVLSSFVLSEELRAPRTPIGRSLVETQEIHFTACGEWKECYQQGDFYTLESLILTGKKGSTPTTFSTEYTLYRQENCGGDSFYHEKVVYSWDSVIVGSVYPYTIDANATIQSSVVRFNEWTYFGKTVDCSGKELNKDYKITELTCLDEEGVDVFATFKTPITKSLLFKDGNVLGYNNGDYAYTSSNGCSSISTGMVVLIVILVVVVILVILLVTIRSKKAKKQDDSDDEVEIEMASKKAEVKVEMSQQSGEVSQVVSEVKQEESVEMKSEEKPVKEKSEEQPTEVTSELPTEVKPEEKPEQPTEVKPEQPVEAKSEEQPTEMKSEQHAEVKPEEKPVEAKSEEQPTEMKSEQPVEATSEQPAETQSN